MCCDTYTNCYYLPIPADGAKREALFELLGLVLSPPATIDGRKFLVRVTIHAHDQHHALPAERMLWCVRLSFAEFLLLCLRLQQGNIPLLYFHRQIEGEVSRLRAMCYRDGISGSIETF